MSDVPTIQERIARATNSSQLEHKDRPCDVDKIGALGMAGIGNAISSAVFRLKYANEARFYSAALQAVSAESMRLGTKHNWTGSAAQYDHLARKCLDYWLNDHCLACEGRGYQTILGTPVLSDGACTSCNGTTRSRPPTMENDVWQDRFAALLLQLEDMERRAGSEVMAKLSSSVADFR